jgi:ubiquinone/menaquinone biosynthesis C-methylase UbiE
MVTQPTFFDFAAEVGLTKHIGGLEATQALVKLCHIGEGAHVLDVGCGVGVTPAWMAGKCRCRVVGVDISARMVERSRERARREGLGDTVEFRQADAQDLPFDDGVFDAVITESVTSFPEDKQRAVREYVRVTKPGGYVGLNESVWLKTPPPPEIVAWVSQDIGASVQPLTADAWVGLLQAAGLTDIIARSSRVDTQEEARGILRRYGLGEFLRIMGRMLSLYARSPAYRTFVKGIRESGVIPANLDEYFGYGLFVGRK